MTLKGNAGFEYTHPDDGGVRTHRLNWPLEFHTGTPLVAGQTKRRWSRRSLDGSARETFSVGSAVETVAATVPFEQLPADLLAVLTIAADGTTLDYFPDLDGETSFALELVGVGDRVEIAQDAEAHGGEEWEGDLLFESTDDLGPLISPWTYHYEAGMSF